jgi:hypothetical protein
MLRTLVHGQGPTHTVPARFYIPQHSQRVNVLETFWVTGHRKLMNHKASFTLADKLELLFEPCSKGRQDPLGG